MVLKHDLEGSAEVSLGAILKQAREAKNINEAEVSQRLLLSKRIIAAIESDDYSKIPAQVYAEGYLRAYAQLVQLAVPDVIEKFRSMNFYNQADTVKSVTSVDEGKVEFTAHVKPLLALFKDQRMRWIAYGVGFFLFLVVIVLAVSSGGSGKDENASVADSGGKLVSQLPVVSETKAQAGSEMMLAPKIVDKSAPIVSGDKSITINLPQN